MPPVKCKAARSPASATAAVPCSSTQDNHHTILMLHSMFPDGSFEGNINEQNDLTRIVKKLGFFTV